MSDSGTFVVSAYASCSGSHSLSPVATLSLPMHAGPALTARPTAHNVCASDWNWEQPVIYQPQHGFNRKILTQIKKNSNVKLYSIPCCCTPMCTATAMFEYFWLWCCQAINNVDTWNNFILKSEKSGVSSKKSKHVEIEKEHHKNNHW